MYLSKVTLLIAASAIFMLGGVLLLEAYDLGCDRGVDKAELTLQRVRKERDDFKMAYIKARRSEIDRVYKPLGKDPIYSAQQSALARVLETPEQRLDRILGPYEGTAEEKEQRAELEKKADAAAKKIQDAMVGMVQKELMQQQPYKAIDSTFKALEPVRDAVKAMGPFQRAETKLPDPE